jgi:hypothetical protein
MKSADVTARVLGIAFLLQAITSLVSGVILKVALTVPGDIARTMSNIANHAGLMRANIWSSKPDARYSGGNGDTFFCPLPLLIFRPEHASLSPAPR